MLQAKALGLSGEGAYVKRIARGIAFALCGMNIFCDTAYDGAGFSKFNNLIKAVAFCAFGYIIKLWIKEI